MAFYDLPLHELQTYQPTREEPEDFDRFWQESLADARQHPLDARFSPADFGMRTVETFDVTFAGYGGQAIKGWLLLPRDRSGPVPCVVEYIGYGGGRGFPTDWLLWSSAGYAHLVMDTRGQGSAWRNGDTPDVAPDGGNAHFPGFMTQGVLDPKTYYYRRVFVDGVRAVEAARSHPAVDAITHRPDRDQPGRRHRAGGQRARARRGRDHARRAVLMSLPPRHRDHRSPPVRGDRPLLQDPPRQRGDGLPHAVVFRRPELRGARQSPSVLLGRVDGLDLPAVYGLRGVQPLRGRRSSSRCTGTTITRGARVTRQSRRSGSWRDCGDDLVCHGFAVNGSTPG